MIKQIWVAIFFMAIAMNNTYTAQQYIKDVQSGEQIACKYVKLAVERHIRDLSRVGNADFPYYFDESQAKRVIDFKRKLRHFEGPLKGKKYEPAPFQQFKDWVLFGWRRLNGYRRFTKAYIEEARKNGKTFDAAATGIYCFYAEKPRDGGTQGYCVATNKEQAHVAFDAICEQIKNQPTLNEISRFWKGGIKGKPKTVTTSKDPAAFFTVWSSDSKTKDGFNPSIVICDEMHEWKTNAMLEVIASGNIARPQPLIYIITTAGLDLNVPCYQEERALAISVLERTIDPAPENLLAIIYTLDEGDDFTDPAVWIKANPNMGVAFEAHKLAERVREALDVPSKRNKVVTKNFSIWTQAATRWILPEAWDACDGEVDAEALKGRTCFVGLDLSTVIDISAYVLVFPPITEGERWKLLCRFFIPGDNLNEREKKDKVPYIAWVSAQLIITTPGNVIDYDFIETELKKDAAKYVFAEIDYDPWKAQEIINHMSQGGITMVPIEQTYRGMAHFTDLFEKAVLSGTIAHGGNPVMKWMMSCTEVKSDRQGGIMPMKPRREASGKRIDGIVAAIMGHGRAILNRNAGRSVYEDRGVIVVAG
jgi:phage terminase large subunit-like protein